MIGGAASNNELQHTAHANSGFPNSNGLAHVRPLLSIYVSPNKDVMHDPWNPMPDEVREWAYAPEALEPCQDWDLALFWVQHERTYLELASDEVCLKRRYFLGVLYFMVGDAVRSRFRNRPRPIIEGLIDRGNEYRHGDIKRWQQRSRELLKHPEHFDYGAWCAGGLAREGEG
jgi:hypothetical protein